MGLRIDRHEVCLLKREQEIQGRQLSSKFICLQVAKEPPP